MINRIINLSVNNKFIVFALVAVACLAGWTHMKNFNFRPDWLCRATNAVSSGEALM